MIPTRLLCTDQQCHTHPAQQYHTLWPHTESQRVLCWPLLVCCAGLGDTMINWACTGLALPCMARNERHPPHLSSETDLNIAHCTDKRLLLHRHERCTKCANVPAADNHHLSDIVLGFSPYTSPQNQLISNFATPATLDHGINPTCVHRLNTFFIEPPLLESSCSSCSCQTRACGMRKSSMPAPEARGAASVRTVSGV